MNEKKMQHVPVLREEVQKYLNLEIGQVAVDATLGFGGHAGDILKKIGKKGVLYAFEQDERNLLEAKKNLSAYKNQIIYFHDNFRYLKKRITGRNFFYTPTTCEKNFHMRNNKYKSTLIRHIREFPQINAILFDLGLSSAHVDDTKRGFSFMKDGPLDMRFDQRISKTAKQIINNYKERDLAKIFLEYGEEKMAYRIAFRICEQRKIKPFTSTKELADFVEKVTPFKMRNKRLHPATKIFQALRIEVNDELNVLKEALAQVVMLLKIGGRVVIISYHSLEDRVVKHFFKSLEKPLMKEPEKAIYRNFDEPFFKNLTKKPVIPIQTEISENPRSRSAKLRAYQKVREIGEEDLIRFPVERE